MNFYVPSKEPDDWKKLLVTPWKQWRTGYSAKTLALCWIAQKPYPIEVKRVFDNYGKESFKDIDVLLVFPEYKVELPPVKGEGSHNDIFVIGRGGNELVSICARAYSICIIFFTIHDVLFAITLLT
jgi:hypothetical protein